MEKKLALAILPSNQAYNPVLGRVNPEEPDEKVQCDRFAQKLYDTIQERYYPRIESKTFYGDPETDTKEFPKLHEQVARGVIYLNSFPPSYEKLLFSIHTDSGTTNQVGVYYGPTERGTSYHLGIQILDVLGRCFHTTDTRKANYGAKGYILWTEMANYIPRILAELGSHEIPEHVRRLHDDSGKIALALAGCIATYYSITPTSSVTPIEHGLNGVWDASLRINDAIARAEAELQAAKRAVIDLHQQVDAIKRAAGLK